MKTGFGPVTVTSSKPPKVPIGAASASTIVPSESKVKPKGTVPSRVELVELTEETPLANVQKETGGFANLLDTRSPLPLGVKEIWAGPVCDTGGVVRICPKALSEPASMVRPVALKVKHLSPLLTPEPTTHT